MRSLLAGQRLANPARGAANTLLRFGFRFNGRHAFRGGDMMLGDADPQMRGALLVAECAAHRRGTQTLPARAFVHVTGVDVQLVHVERRAGIFGLAFGIGDGAAQHLFNVLRGTLLREVQRVQRVLGLLPANQIHHQASLLRRHAHMLGQRVRFDVGLRLL